MSTTRYRLEPADAFDRLRRRLDDEVVGKVMKDRLDDLGDKGVRMLRGVAPVGPTGNYKRRIESTIEGKGADLTLEVSSRSRHRHLVEAGRRPGRMPSPKRIAKLYRLPIEDAFLVARAIGKRGTRGKYPVRQIRRSFGPEVAKTGKDIVKDLRKIAERT